MSIYFDLVDECTIEDQMMDMFIDQLHRFAESYEENRPVSTSDFYWSSSSAD